MLLASDAKRRSPTKNQWLHRSGFLPIAKWSERYHEAPLLLALVIGEGGLSEMVISNDSPITKRWHDDVFRSRRQSAVDKRHGNDEPSIIAKERAIPVRHHTMVTYTAIKGLRRL